MMREFTRVKSHIAALQDLQAGTVDIYCFQTAIESFVAPVLHELNVRFPNVFFNVRMSSTDEAIEALTTGAAEVGLILNPPNRDAIKSTEVFRDAIVAVVSPDHPITRRKTISLRELVEYPLALAEGSFGLRQQIDNVLDRHRIEANVVCATNSLALMKRVVSFGRQCTLLPRMAVEQEVAAGTLRTVALREFKDQPLLFCASEHKGRTVSPAAKVFVNAVAEYCRRHRR